MVLPFLSVRKLMPEVPSKGEDFYSKVVRIADSLKDSSEHFEDFKDVLRNMRFIPAEVQNAMGCPSDHCLQLLCFWYDCYGKHHEPCKAAETMQRWWHGYDFGNIVLVVTALNHWIVKHLVPLASCVSLMLSQLKTTALL